SSSGLQVMPIFVQPVFIQPNSVFSRVQSVNHDDLPLCNMEKKELSLFVVNFEKSLRTALKQFPVPPPKTSAVRYNLVVVGKAGVGKSELINYLFGKEIVKTGIGKPITKIGFHREDFNI